MGQGWLLCGRGELYAGKTCCNGRPTECRDLHLELKAAQE